MAINSKQYVQSILNIVKKPLAAKEGAEFLEGVREGFESLYAKLLSSGHKKKWASALDAAFSQTMGSFREHRVLELCAWPIFDKPALPAQDKGDFPEFLWMFCIPFVVQFAQHETAAPLNLPENLFDGQAVLRKLSQGTWFNPQAMLAGFPVLLSREDLHLTGPSSLASLFVEAELGGPVVLRGLPHIFDEEIESGRVATFYMVASARMQCGESRLMLREGAWPAEKLEQMLMAGFAKNGIDVEQVRSLPACSMAEALFRCTPAGEAELRLVLELAKAHYGVKEVLVRYPLAGMAELTGLDQDGEGLLLCSPFAFIEPKRVLQDCIGQACLAQGLTFTGGFSTATQSSSMIH